MFSEQSRSALRGRIHIQSGLPRMYRVAGLFLLVVVTASFGLPLPGASYLLAPISLIIGFGLARSVLARAQHEQWWLPTVAYYLANLAIPILVVLAVATVFRWAAWAEPTTPLGSPHLGMVVVAIATGALTPFVLLTQRQRIGRNRRAVALASLAAVLAGARICLLLSRLGPQLPSATIVVDPMLAGMALGVMPQSMFHRHPVRHWTAPAAVLLAIVVVTPPTVVANSVGLAPPGSPVLKAILAPLAALCTAILVWSEANNNLRGPLVRLVDHHLLSRIADRGICIYVFHLLFLMILGGGAEVAGGQWPGPAIFAITLVLTATAATICRWSIIDPILTGLDSLAVGAQPRNGRSIVKSGRSTHPAAKTMVLEPMRPVTRHSRCLSSPATTSVHNLVTGLAEGPRPLLEVPTFAQPVAVRKRFPPPVSKLERTIDLRSSPPANRQRQGLPTPGAA